MIRNLKLYDFNGRFVKNIEMPSSFLAQPEVIFYGARAFQSTLGRRGEYSECHCWRAPDPEEKPA